LKAQLKMVDWKAPKLWVAISFGISILVNGIFATGAVGGKSIGDVSDEHPTYITPDGPTFAIWGVIYVLEAVTVIFQFRSDERTEQLMAHQDLALHLENRWRLVIVFSLNALWLPLFVLEWFNVCVFIIGIMAAFLVSVYMSLDISKTQSLLEWLQLSAGITCNTSWVIVAFTANIFIACGESGWKDYDGPYGVAGTPVAAAFSIFLIAALGSGVALMNHDLAWSLVALWAVAGIYRMQDEPDPAMISSKAQSSLVATAAWWSMYLLAAASVASAALYVRRMLLERRELAGAEALPLQGKE